MKWAVLVALVLLGLGTYSLIGSARELGAAVGEMSGGRAVAAGPPRLMDRDVRVKRGMALLDLRCENEIGCGGVLTLTLQGDEAGTARYTMLEGQTTRFAIPLPPGAPGGAATLSWREDSGVTATTEVELKRA